MKNQTENSLISKAFLSVTALAVFTMATPVMAQSAPKPPPTPRSFQNNGTDFKDQFDRKNFNIDDPVQKNYHGATAMAKCVMRRAKDAAPGYFGGPTTDDPEYKDLAGVLTGKYSNCMEKTVAGVPMFIVNAALAEQLLLKDETVLPDKALSLNMDKAEAFYLTDGKITSLAALNGCIAVYSPGLVQKMLKTDPSSDEEGAALKAIYAGTPECGLVAPPELPSLEHREMLATKLYEWLSST